MKKKRLPAALLLIVALGFVALGVVKMRSTGADVSTQVAPQATPDTGPTESVFGEHSYTLPDNFIFAPPPEGLPPPAVSREEIIAQVEAGFARARADARILSADLVTIDRSPAAEPPPGQYWFVFVEGVFWSQPGGLGGPVWPDGSPCDAPPEQQPLWCKPHRYRGTSYALYEPETGSLFAYGNDEGRPCDPPTEGVEPC